MYPNLKAEMARRGLSQNAMAALADMKPQSFRAKMAGIRSFSLDEGMKVRAALDNAFTLEYLFAKRGE